MGGVKTAHVTGGAGKTAPFFSVPAARGNIKPVCPVLGSLEAQVDRRGAPPWLSRRSGSESLRNVEVCRHAKHSLCCAALSCKASLANSSRHPGPDAAPSGRRTTIRRVFLFASDSREQGEQRTTTEEKTSLKRNPAAVGVPL